MEEQGSSALNEDIPGLVESDTEESDEESLDSPPFHGYESDTFFPSKIQIIEPDNVDEDIKVSRTKGTIMEEQGNSTLNEDIPGLVESDTEETDEESSDSPPFHGFFPSKIQIIEPDNVDEDIKVSRIKRKQGRPKGAVKKVAQLLLPHPLPKRRLSTPSASSLSNSSTIKTESVSPSTVVGPPKFKVAGTSTRAVIYLIDQTPTSDLGAAKLPKTGGVLRVLFHFLLNDPKNAANPNSFTLATKAAVLLAATQTVPILKNVWLHHFGLRLVFGQDYVGGPISAEHIMVNTDRRTAEKIATLYEEWKTIEQLSRRGDRKELLQRKEIKFRGKLELPFSILKKNGEEILCNSGIKDWKEELQHLRNQLSPSQIGSCDGFDMRQKKRDDRLLQEQERIEKKIAKEDMDRLELERLAKMEKENVDDDFGDNNNATDIDFKAPIQNQPRQKINVMGPISMTADAHGISMRGRTALAASVISALNLNVNDTNINVNTAWLKAKQGRLDIEAKVHDEFVSPDRVSLHWDGKLLKLKGNVKTNRVAVLIAGADAEKVKKLLSIPETEGGSGKDEAEVVITAAVHWKVKERIVSIVFDTTLTNSSGNVGACYYLELWVGSPILWNACRHHIYELHIGRVREAVMGSTKDPGVPLFRRLKSEWYKLEINYDNLQLFDYNSVPEWMVEEAKKVLTWGLEELKKILDLEQITRNFLSFLLTAWVENLKASSSNCLRRIITLAG